VKEWVATWGRDNNNSRFRNAFNDTKDKQGTFQQQFYQIIQICRKYNGTKKPPRRDYMTIDYQKLFWVKLLEKRKEEVPPPSSWITIADSEYQGEKTRQFFLVNFRV
jgi:hypothetical protein